MTRPNNEGVEGGCPLPRGASESLNRNAEHFFIFLEWCRSTPELKGKRGIDFEMLKERASVTVDPAEAGVRNVSLTSMPVLFSYFRDGEPASFETNVAQERGKAWSKLQQASRDSWWRKEHETQLEEHREVMEGHIRGYAPVTLPMPLRELVFAATGAGFNHFADVGFKNDCLLRMIGSFDRSGLVRAVDFEKYCLHFTTDDDAVEFRLRYL